VYLLYFVVYEMLVVSPRAPQGAMNYSTNSISFCPQIVVQMQDPAAEKIKKVFYLPLPGSQCPAPIGGFNRCIVCQFINPSKIG
jgi:hypothetical protein